MSQSSLNEVMRFVLLRPPAKATSNQQIVVEVNTDFQRNLQNVQLEKQAVLKLAQDFREGPLFVEDLQSLQNGSKLIAILDTVSSKGSMTNKEIINLFKKEFCDSLSQLIKDLSFQEDYNRLTDTLLAIQYLPEYDGSAFSRMNAFRIMGAIKLAAENQDKKIDISLEKLIKDAVLVFPFAHANTNSNLPENPPIEGKVIPSFVRFQNAIYELMELDRRGLLTLAPVVRPEPIDNNPTVLETLSNQAVGDLSAESSVMQVRNLSTPNLTVPNSLLKSLSTSTQELLGDIKIDVTQTPLPLAVSLINNAAERIATTTLKDSVSGYVLWNKVPIPLFDIPIFPIPPKVPQTKGRVRPAGIADLQIVKQQLKGYEGGEVAHIENVLKGENKERSHRVLERSEQTFTVETERIEEEQRELTTTDRFEIQREVSKTISEDASLKAGLSISGSYGPTVEFDTSFEVSYERSTEESAKAASRFAKDVTDRSLKRLVEKVREERIQVLTKEIEDKNLHSLNNTDGSDHISGIYQWVDKVYEAQVFNYGKRLLFDVMVPEPAAFFLHSRTIQAQRPDIPIPPDPLTLNPSDLNEYNYTLYVAKYGATGVTPPPAPYTYTAKTFEERTGEEGANKFTKSAELTISEGYLAVGASANWVGSRTGGSSWFDIFIGDQKITTHNQGWGGGNIFLNFLRGAIPVGMNSGGIESFTLVMQIRCQRSEELLAQWRLKTFDAIRQAYLERQREFEQKMAQILAQTANVQIQGLNPGENRRIERTELRKATISILTEQRYELFNAMSDAVGAGYPEFNFEEAAAEGSYIRFFENAFEWEQMTYLFYPYFWGRKQYWNQRSGMEDTDPQFAEFLKAGFARVVIPVRPGFESAIFYFLETGLVWNGSDAPPEVTSPLYVSLVQEIKERTGSFDNEVPVGEPWEVRIPTSLLKLRQDDQLPRWEKQDDGTWEPTS